MFNRGDIVWTEVVFGIIFVKVISMNNDNTFRGVIIKNSRSYDVGWISDNWITERFKIHQDLNRLAKLKRIFNNETL